MRVFHAAKTEEGYRAIMRDHTILCGRNLAYSEPLAHVSLKPFMGGEVDSFGPDTNQAWIFECEIANDTALTPDPSDGNIFKSWRVSKRPIHLLRIKAITHIPDLMAWDLGEGEEVPIPLP